jgi:hypothetical protein
MRAGNEHDEKREMLGTACRSTYWRAENLAP